MIFANGYYLSPGDSVYQSDKIVVVYTGLCGDFINTTIALPSTGSTNNVTVTNVIVPSDSPAGTMTTTITRSAPLPALIQTNPVINTPRPCTFDAGGA